VTTYRKSFLFGKRQSKSQLLLYVFLVCRDEETTAAMGSISSTNMYDTVDYYDTTPEECSFLIKAPPEQQIEISCSSFNISYYPAGVFYILQVSPFLKITSFYNSILMG
jgi:hypothetical protein